MDKDNHFKTKHLIAVGVTLIVLIAVLLLGNSLNNNIKSYQFAGNLVSIEGNIVKVSGFYLNSQGVAIDLMPEPKEVNVEVTEKTTIERESFKVPETSEIFYPDKLPKETTTVNLSKVLEDSSSGGIGFIIDSDSNIFNKDKFLASKMTYRVPIFNKPR